MFNSETLWAAAYQAPLSMGFPRQECWSGMPFPSSVYLSDPGIESELGDLGLITGLQRSIGEGKGYPLQYSGLENFTTV